jgi:ABC-type bacteriocin/lantibiotic exporter with double-glycine peptidase domain
VIGQYGILKHKTRVLVTHELSYIQHADLVVIMSEGRIVSSGSYLMVTRNGELAKLLAEVENEKANANSPGFQSLIL